MNVPSIGSNSHAARWRCASPRLVTPEAETPAETANEPSARLISATRFEVSARLTAGRLSWVVPSGQAATAARRLASTPMSGVPAPETWVAAIAKRPCGSTA